MTAHRLRSTRFLRQYLIATLAVILTTILAVSPTSAQDCGWGYYMHVDNPYAGAEYTRGDAIDINWYADYIYWYGNVTTVALEYSDDGGANWNLIADGIPTDQNYYQWQTTPSLTPGTDYYIRVSEQADGYYFYCSPNSPGLGGPFTILKGCAPPIFSQQLVPASVCTGQSTTFSVQTDATRPTYRWMKDGNVVATTNSNTFTIFPVQASNAGSYSVEVIDVCGATGTSSNALLTVRIAPTITQQMPATISVCENSTVVLSIRAIGDGRSFQWRRDSVNIPGATDSNYVIGNALATTAGKYECVVSGICTPAVVSTACNLYVLGKPRIITEPTDLAVCPGTTAQLSLITSAGNIGYQWYKDGQAIAGATSATYSLPNYNYSMNGRYQCVATAIGPNPNNCPIMVNSRIATVSGLRPPTFKTQPTTMDACIGSRATLVSAADGFDLSYQWYRNGVAIPNGTQNALTIASVSAADAGAYTVKATGSCGLNVTSDTARILAISKPTLTQQPADQNVLLGQTITLSVDGTDIREIQWYKNSQPIANATGKSYTITTATLADAGVYNAILRNSCGGAISGYARVSVKDPSQDTPELTLSTAVIDFGEIPIGYEKSYTATGLIKNSGLAPMSVLAVTVTGEGYSITAGNNTPFSLQPNETSTVSLVARPNDLGERTGTLQVVTNAPSPSGIVLLNATSVLRYQHAAALDFGSVEAGKSKELCVTLTNTSSVDVTIDATPTSGPNASSFVVVTAAPISIAAGTTKDVCITFSPADAGAKSANMSVASSTGGNSNLTLSGVGTPTVSVNDGDLTNGYAVFPNPSSGSVLIRSKHDMRSISIVNAAGHTIATIDGRSTGASTELRWNGMMTTGELAPSGIYTVVIRAADATVTVPLAIVR